MDPLKLLVLLELQDKMSGALDTVQGKLEGFKSKAGTIGKALGGVGVAATGAGALVVGMATEMNEGLSEVSTLIPGQEARLNELKAAVQDLSVEFGTPTSGLVGGLYEGISAFGDSADTVKILETNTKAAKAGVAEVGQAIALTSAVTKGYNTVTAEGVQRAADLAFKTVELGQTNFPQLAASIGKVVPIASSLSVSQEELFGVMATATGVTGGAAEVSTQLRGTLQALMAPTASMSGLFESMGVSSGKALIEQEGLQGAVHAVVKAAEATGEPLTKYISSIEGVTLAQTLAGSQADNWATKTAAMESAAGSVDVAFGEMTEGVNASGFALDQYKAQMVVWGQQAGQAIIDFSGPLATGLLGVSEFGGSLAMMAPQITALMVSMGGWSGIMGIVGTAGKAMWAGLTGPIGLAITAVAAIAGAWYLWGDEITGFIAGPWNSFLGAIETGLNWLAPFASKIGIDLPTDLGTFKIKMEEATAEVDEARPSFADLAAEVEAVGAESTVAVPEVEAVTVAIQTAGTEAEITKGKFDLMKVDGIQSFKDLSREAKSIMQNHLVREMSQLAGTGGLDVSAAFSAGFLGDGPGGIMTELPAGTLRALEKSHGGALPKFAESGFDHGVEWQQGFEQVISADNIFGTISRAFEGGGGWMGGIKSVGTQIGGSLFEGVKSGSLAKLPGMMGEVGGKVSALWTGVSSAVSAIPFAGPILAAFGPQILQGLGAIGKKVWGSIKGMFGGPSENELLARDTFGAFSAQAISELEGIEAYDVELQSALQQGWSETEAQTVAAFLSMGKQAGLTHEEAFDKYAQYEEAVRTGNTTLMGQLESEYEGWRDAAEGFNTDMERDWGEMTVANKSKLVDELGNMGTEYDGFVNALKTGDFDQIKSNWSSLTADQKTDLAAKLADMDNVVYSGFVSNLNTGDFAALKGNWASLTADQKSDLEGKLDSMDSDTYGGFVKSLKDGDFEDMKTNWALMNDEQKLKLSDTLTEMDDTTYSNFVETLKTGEFQTLKGNWDATLGESLTSLDTWVGNANTKFGNLDTEHNINWHHREHGSPPSGGDSNNYPGGAGEEMSGGSGGILDFGTGTPAILHNREAVITEASIMRMIAAAASGGRQDASATTSQRPIVLKVDRRVLAEVVEEERSRARNRLGVTTVR